MKCKYKKKQGDLIPCKLFDRHQIVDIQHVIVWTAMCSIEFMYLKSSPS